MNMYTPNKHGHGSAKTFYHKSITMDSDHPRRCRLCEKQYPRDNLTVFKNKFVCVKCRGELKC